MTGSQQDKLLDQLERLPPPQFDKVVYRVRVPPGDLSGAQTPQSTRALELLRYMAQQGKLDQLERIVRKVVKPPEDPEDDDGGRAPFGLWRVVFVGAAFVAVMIVVGMHRDPPRPPAGGVTPGPADTPVIPDRLLSPKDDRPLACSPDMVQVSAGTFQMGSPAGVGNKDEYPQREVSLPAYCIDRTEVTVKAYADCVQARGCPPALQTVLWGGISADELSRFSGLCNREDQWNHPINCVDWNQASDYCKWASKRLPTEAEWEYAARGKEGRVYPWGNEAPRPTRLNGCGRECVAMAKQLGLNWTKTYDASDPWVTTAPVGSVPADASPFGALDLGGNVSEWTADWYVPYPTPQQGTTRVVRGGAWDSPAPDQVRAAHRQSYEASNRYNHVGFRCARKL